MLHSFLNLSISFWYTGVASQPEYPGQSIFLPLRGFTTIRFNNLTWMRGIAGPAEDFTSTISPTLNFIKNRFLSRTRMTGNPCLRVGRAAPYRYI